MTQLHPSDATPPRRRSALSLFLAAVFLVLLLGFLSILTMGFAPLFLLTVLGVGLLIAFHYVVWGWWLSQVIRREVEAEQAKESPTQSR